MIAEVKAEASETRNDMMSICLDWLATIKSGRKTTRYRIPSKSSIKLKEQEYRQSKLDFQTYWYLLTKEIRSTLDDYLLRRRSKRLSGSTEKAIKITTEAWYSGIRPGLLESELQTVTEDTAQLTLDRITYRKDHRTRSGTTVWNLSYRRPRGANRSYKKTQYGNSNNKNGDFQWIATRATPRWPGPRILHSISRLCKTVMIWVGRSTH
jgi:hypothetical protein